MGRPKRITDRGRERARTSAGGGSYNAAMAILKVARMGHPVLRARAGPLDPAEIRSASIQKLIDDMFDTMHEYQGVGLAAPQVHESVRLFVAGFPASRERREDDGDAERVPEMAL